MLTHQIGGTVRLGANLVGLYDGLEWRVALLDCQ